MKIIYQIFVICFVILSLFIVKDDVKVAYQKVYSYIMHSKGESALAPSQASLKAPFSGQDPVPVVDHTEKKSTASKKADAPGALRVLDSFLSKESGQSKLSAHGVIALTNQERHIYGDLDILLENRELNASAQKKVDDMFAKQYFEHVSPSGVGVEDLATRVGYEYIIIGENLALGNFKDDQALVAAWMASPGHRANILNTHYSEIGVAVGHGMFEGKDTWLAVQHFGLPRNACPQVDDMLHTTIAGDQAKISRMEADLATRKARIDSGAVYDGYTNAEQIDQYNQIIKTYNQLIVDTKEKIDRYNAGVKEFNSCVNENKKK